MDAEDDFMNDIVTFGVVVRAPLYVAKELREVLKKHRESISFSFHQYSSKKLVLAEDVMP